MAQQLFAAIRTGKVKPGMGAEFARRVEAGALPMMKQLDGFKGYYLVLTPADTVMAVSLFTSKTTAETSTQHLMPWIKENLGPLLASPPEATDGDVLISAVSAWNKKPGRMVPSGRALLRPGDDAGADNPPRPRGDGVRPPPIVPRLERILI